MTPGTFTDALLYETGSGGDMVLRNNDIVTVAGYENMPYLSMYGGNGSWMDDLLLIGDQKHTAQTETALQNTPLTSQGRQIIEDAINADLQFLVDDVEGTAVDVAVSIPSKNRVDAAININGQTIYMNWHPDAIFLNYEIK